MSTTRIVTTPLLTAISAPALSEAILVEDFRHLVLQLFLVGATGVFKVKAANTDGVVFSDASTVANPWYYIDLVGLGDGGTTVTGSVGVSTTTANQASGYAINVDMARWVVFHATALSAGSASAILSAATNE